MTADTGTNDTVGQSETADDTTAGQTDPTTDTGQSDGGDHDAAGDHAEDDGDRGTGGRERHLRQRAQAAEAERDALAETLTRTRQVIVDAAVRAVGHDPVKFGRLLTAAEHTVDSLLDDDGMVDLTRLAEAVNTTARDFNLTGRGTLTPSPQQGTSGGNGQLGSSSWSEALKGG